MKKEAVNNIKRAIATKRKKKNNAEDYFKSIYYILESVKIGLWDWDLLSGEAVYSKQYETLLGFDEGEMKGTINSWSALIFPEDKHIAEEMVDEYIFDNNNDFFEIEIRMYKKNGSVIWVQQKGTALEFDEFGRPTRISGTLQEIKTKKS